MSRSEPITPRVSDIPQGFLLFDTAVLDDAPSQLFEPSSDVPTLGVGGRGAALLRQTPAGPCVVRFSRRGGLAAKLSDDRYVYLGADRTRTFREWYLLADLYARGLPVPRPVAAYFQRTSGVFYKCGLATELIADACSLGEQLTSLPDERWYQVGQCIRLFSRAGVSHPDLNAHNVLMQETGGVYLIDFDRARAKSGPIDDAPMVERLERSIRKLVGSDPFPERGWRKLRSGCAGDGEFANS